MKQKLTRTISEKWASVAAACFVSALSFPGTAFGDDAPVIRYITPDSAALRSDPGGSLRGNLRKNLPVHVMDSKGGWSHVAVDGWIRDTELAAGESSTTESTTATPLRVVKFELEKVDRDKKSDPSRVRLKVQVRNDTKQSITGWSALLVIDAENGTNLLRTRVEGGVIAQGATEEFNYYWADDEPLYEKLAPQVSRSNTLTVNLAGIQLK